jgi:hypothetical protein
LTRIFLSQAYTQWIEGDTNALPVGLGYRSSRQLIGALQCDPRRTPSAILDIMNGQMLYVRGRDAPVYLPLRIPPMPLPAPIIRNSLPHYTENYVLWTALHLLEGKRRVLISVAQSPERLMKRFAEAFDLPGWETLPPFELPADPIDGARFEETRATCIDYCGANSYELRLLNHGIATSHGQMPQRLRRLMVDLIDRRICAITVATATLTEGVNLPFDIIFLTSILRRGFDVQTFARVAAAQEDFLERSVVQRGRAFVERLYPNHEQRRRLYQYGFTPYVGRRFELVAPQLIAELQGAANFGAESVEARFQLFFRLGERVRAEPGIGYRVRQTAGDQIVLANWIGVLGWWMQRPEAVAPTPDNLRAWQRFVTEDLKFRLGVAVGAAVAQAWGRNAGDLETPTLETWRATTGLPWIGFWFRELLRWGTLDPFVAFALAQGLARTRDEAALLRPEFEAWLAAEGFDRQAETLIDPQRFLAWQRSRILQPVAGDAVRASAAQLTQVDGRRGAYDVRPIVRNDGVEWIDAAGYSVGRSLHSQALLTTVPERHDFRLTAGPVPEVVRTF